jgi:hypothetical protein
MRHAGCQFRVGPAGDQSCDGFDPIEGNIKWHKSRDDFERRRKPFGDQDVCPVANNEFGEVTFDALGIRIDERGQLDASIPSTPNRS